MIELGLEQAPGLMTLIDRILSLIPDATAESERLQSSEFREEIRCCREQIHNRKPMEPIARKMLDLCQGYFKRSRIYRLEREREYLEMIEVLRDAVSTFAGDSTSFNAQLVSSTDRFNRLVDLDDIRMIKEQISREVSDLRRTVEEKQKQDEENLKAMARRVEMLQIKLSRAADEAATDALTRISNRGNFDKTISRWITESVEQGRTFVFALADIDDFKRVNDTYGHPVGDRVLMGAAQMLAASVRPDDFVARYGGEEFAVLLSGMKLQGAEMKMEQLLKTIAAYRFEYDESKTLQFTLSCGMAEFAVGDNVESLITRADEALYEAKRKGKNRVASRKKSLLKSMFK